MVTEEQRAFIGRRLNEGASLATVQQELAKDCGVSITYLDLRLLAADLEVDWQQHEPPPKATKPDAAVDDAAAGDGVGGGPDDRDAAVGGGTRVTVSRLARPGAAMHGNVEFKSGAEAEWVLDRYGQLQLNPGPGSARPTEEDLREFQAELQRQLTGGR